MSGFYGAAIFVFGTCVGSFLNVCIWRIPRDESLIKPGSHCPKCNTLMRVKSNGESGDLFWGCPRYPDCKGTRKFSEADWEAHTGYGSPGEGPPPDNDAIAF